MQLMKGGKLYNVFLNDISTRMGRELYSRVSEEWSFCLPVCHCPAEFEYEILFLALRSDVFSLCLSKLHHIMIVRK